MKIEEIQTLISENLENVQNKLASAIESRIKYASMLAAHLIENRGKSVRPTMVLLVAHAISDCNEKHLDLAVILELIHAATLLHDDVVDSSNLRRGKETVNKIWGNKASVLVGDFLYSKAFQLMTKINNMEVMKILSDFTNVIAEGEIMQLQNSSDIGVSEDTYMEIIASKTGALFSAAATVVPALLEESVYKKDVMHVMSNYGMHLGIAFQLSDDALDYSSSASSFGKEIGIDITHGKVTLPLIYAMKKYGKTSDLLNKLKFAPDSNSSLLQGINNYTSAETSNIIALVTNTGAIDYTLSMANKHAKIAIDAINNSPILNSKYKTALCNLAEIAAHRIK